MKRLIFTLTIVAMCVLALQARTRTTHARLNTDVVAVEMLQTAQADSLASGVDPTAISLRGFNKRASDSKESFFITNNLKHRISAVRLLMQYTTIDGGKLHERTVTIPVTLNAGDTQLVSVKSFDIQRLFYYYAGPKPRKSASPFKVAYRLLGYDIPVGY